MKLAHWKLLIAFSVIKTSSKTCQSGCVVSILFPGNQKVCSKWNQFLNNLPRVPSLLLSFIEEKGESACRVGTLQ